MNLNAFLLVDAGNTHTKWATTPIGEYKPFQVAGEIATGDATPAFFRSLAAKSRQHYLVLASVVPGLVPSVRQAFKRRFHLVNAASSGLRLDYDYPNPGELGADRLAAAVAVKSDKLYPAIIVAAGTATAFTVVDARGRLCGGAIAPGLGAQLAALLGATAQLPATDLRLPVRSIGKSTADAIRLGVLTSFHGGVKATTTQLLKSMTGKKRPRLILTGGNAEIVAKNLGRRHRLRPLLVLEGLRIIANRVWNPESK